MYVHQNFVSLILVPGFLRFGKKYLLGKKTNVNFASHITMQYRVIFSNLYIR